MVNKSGDEECRRGERGEPGEPAQGPWRPVREQVERALAMFPAPEPRPSKEEVESVFRSVTASY